jgi:hypothetical protein
MRTDGGRSGLISATIVATAMAFTASTALVKGPESVTLDGPGIDEPIELDTVDPGLVGRAMEQTGLWWAARGDRPLPIKEPLGGLGPGYTLTWVLYAEPGRREDEPIRQLVYPFAPGGVVVHTPSQKGLRGVPEVVGWFEAPALQGTLARLGVPVPAASWLRGARPPELAEVASAERQRVGASPYLVAGLGLVAVLAVVVAARHRSMGLRRIRSSVTR